MFIGAALIGIGINWFIGGLFLRSANKDIATDGILLAFLFGALGVFFWLIISHPDNRFLGPPTRTEEVHKHCPNCNLAVPFSSVQFCPHCGQKLSHAKPEYTISECANQEDEPHSFENVKTVMQAQQTVSIQINPKWSLFVGILAFIGIFLWQFLAATELHTNNINLLFVYPSIWGLSAAFLVGITLYEVFKHKIVENITSEHQ